MKVMEFMNLLSLATLFLFVVAFFVGFRRPELYKKLTLDGVFVFTVIAVIASGAVFVMAIYDFSLLVSAIIVVIQVSSTGLLCLYLGSMSKAYILQKSV